MPPIPAICRNCGIIFGSGVHIPRKDTFATFVDCSAVCPRCKGPADIPNGTYSALSDTILAFTKGTVTKEHLRELVRILEGGKDSQLEPKRVADEIRSDLPELSSLADVLPTTRKELYAFIGVIAACVIALLTLIDHVKPTPTMAEDRVQELVEKTLSKVNESSDRRTPTVTPTRSIQKAGALSRDRSRTGKKKRSKRNAPCPCGSGRKYKKCCGAK